MPLPLRQIAPGLEVSVLGFGGAPLGDLYTHLDDDQAINTVVHAGAGGITLFDTSPLYGHGLSEHRIGTALRRMTGEKVICTKVGRVLSPARTPDWNRSGYLGGLPFEAQFDYSYDGTMRALEQSLLRLGVSQIDIALIHDVDIWTHGLQNIDRRFGEAMEGAYRALSDLRSQKVVKAIGVGVNEAEICTRFAHSGEFDCMLLAGRYSLLEQEATHDFLPLAMQKHIAILLGGVFNSGILATGARAGAYYNYRPAPPEVLARVARMETICQRHGVALPHAAIQFPLAHSAIASIVLGAVTPEEVDRNLTGLRTPIPEALWQDMRLAGLILPEAPTP